MKYTIDEDVCKKEGISLPSLFALLLVKTGANISTLFQELESKQLIIKDLFSNYLVTQHWNDVCDKILLNSEKNTSTTHNNIEGLAVKLMAIMPQCKKEGTPYFYKCNKREVTLKLQKFFKVYGKYSEEQILNATQRYVDSFNGNYTYMKLLKYFIMKDERRINNEGVGYIEEVSQLATFLENEDATNNDNCELV